MRVAHECCARTAFHFGARRCDAGRVIVAGLTLRFGTEHVRAQVYWPSDADSATLLLADRYEDANQLSSAADTVVVALTRRQPFELELSALSWVADHAAELSGTACRLVVAGGAPAAHLAALARDAAWPMLWRQLLIHPRFTPACPMPGALGGLAPAALLSAPSDDGAAYAELLHAAGVEVTRLASFADLLTVPR
jgi:hypothetical protein